MITAEMTVREASAASADARRLFEVLGVNDADQQLLSEVAARLRLDVVDLLHAINKSQAAPVSAACNLDL